MVEHCSAIFSWEKILQDVICRTNNNLPSIVQLTEIDYFHFCNNFLVKYTHLDTPYYLSFFLGDRITYPVVY